MARQKKLPKEIHAKTFNPDGGTAKSSRDLKHSQYIAYSEKKKEREAQIKMSDIPSEWVYAFGSTFKNKYVQVHTVLAITTNSFGLFWFGAV